MPRAKVTARKAPAKPKARSRATANDFQQMIDERTEYQEYAVNLENVVMTIQEAIEEIGEAVPLELMETPKGTAVVNALNNALSAVEAWQEELEATPDDDEDE